MSSDKKKSSENLIWLDMEMTGLDPANDHVIEIACLATDKHLNILEKGPEIIIHQSESLFEKMDQWNQNQHTKSGLWEKVLQSNVGLKEAENEVLDFIKKWVPENKGILAGNSIWQDRRFIINHMPNIHNFLHYRMIDVTSIKLVLDKWTNLKPYVKKNTHRAMDDIVESLEELLHYRQYIKIDTTATN